MKNRKKNKPLGFGISQQSSKNNTQALSIEGFNLTRRHFCKVNADGSFTVLATIDFTTGEVIAWGGGDHE